LAKALQPTLGVRRSRILRFAPEFCARAIMKLNWVRAGANSSTCAALLSLLLLLACRAQTGEPSKFFRDYIGLKDDEIAAVRNGKTSCIPVGLCRFSIRQNLVIRVNASTAFRDQQSKTSDNARLFSELRQAGGGRWDARDQPDIHGASATGDKSFENSC
jgi:hypothetical protein